MNSKLLLLLSSGLLIMSTPAYSLDINVMSPDKSTESGHDLMHVNKPVSDVSTDQKVTQDVKDAFHADQKLMSHASSVDVKVDSGVVTLSGTVASDEVKKSFGEKAEHVTGVSKVVNNIVVK